MTRADVERVLQPSPEVLAEARFECGIRLSSSFRSTTSGDPADAVRAPLPSAGRAGGVYEALFVNDGSRDRSAALLKDQFLVPTGRDAGHLVQRQLRPAHSDHGQLRILPGQRVVTLDADFAESAGNRQAAGGDGSSPRLCG